MDRKWLDGIVFMASLIPPQRLGKHMVAVRVLDEHVDLTGCKVERCMFDGCVLELWRGRADGPSSIRHTNFVDCKFIGDGWPKDLVSA